MAYHFQVIQESCWNRVSKEEEKNMKWDWEDRQGHIHARLKSVTGNREVTSSYLCFKISLCEDMTYGVVWWVVIAFISLSKFGKGFIENKKWGYRNRRKRRVLKMDIDTLEGTWQAIFTLLRLLLGSCQYSPRHFLSYKRLYDIKTSSSNCFRHLEFVICG